MLDEGLDRCELRVQRALLRGQSFLVVLERAGEGGTGGVDKRGDLRKRHANAAVERNRRAPLKVRFCVDAVIRSGAGWLKKPQRLPVAQRLRGHAECLGRLADRVLVTICHDAD